MTQSRSLRFQSLQVHRPADRAAARPVGAAPKLRFTDLLKSRRSAPAAALQAASDMPPSEEEEALDAPTDDRLLQVPEEAPPRNAAEPAQPTEVEEAPPGWLDAVVPHAALLEPVLQVHPVVASIAHTVSRFCNERAVSESEGWQVRIPLREDMLAGTTLHLMLSPLWLQVRFETSEQRSRDLLLAHRESLASLLDAALSRRREIAVSID